MRPLGTLLATALVAVLLTQPAADAAPAPASARAAAAAPARPAVIAKRVIGTSVRGRPIVAWHLGEPRAPGVQTVVLISTMHGDEPHTRRILETLRDGDVLITNNPWFAAGHLPDDHRQRDDDQTH